MFDNRWALSGIIVFTLFFFLSVLKIDAWARIGGVRSIGSRTEPVKFNEYWTFTRPVGDYPWKLSAITQVD